MQQMRQMHQAIPPMRLQEGLVIPSLEWLDLEVSQMLYLEAGNQLVSTSEAAQRLGVDRSTLLRWISQGVVPARRIGRSYKIALRDLERVPIDAAVPTTSHNGSRQELTTEPTTPPRAAMAAREVVMVFADDLNHQRERWLASLRTAGKPKAARTVDGYERQFRKFLTILSQVVPKTSLDLHDVINHNHVEDVLSQIPPEQYSTRYQVYCAVVSFCNFLVRREIVDERMRNKLKRVRPERNRDPKRTFFKDEGEIKRFFEAIWAAPGNTYYEKRLVEATAKMLLNTGIRRAELCSLRIEDVSFDRKAILVRCGKGGKSRQLGINTSLLTALEAYIKARPVTDCPNFFVTEEGGMIRPEYLSRRMQRVAKRSGVEVSCHSFRRTYATQRVLKGAPIALVQGAFGHSSPYMTFEYVRLQPFNVLESMQQCDDIDPTTTTAPKAYPKGQVPFSV